MVRWYVFHVVAETIDAQVVQTVHRCIATKAAEEEKQANARAKSGRKKNNEKLRTEKQIMECSEKANKFFYKIKS